MIAAYSDDPPQSDAHWNMYNEMDVMLDSWPYCGTVTSAECLMMGVCVCVCVFY
jgi:predicted O-linked N-acetylglucosamine transferase (SPINDLY family)